jgi:hypothetical protein
MLCRLVGGNVVSEQVKSVSELVRAGLRRIDLDADVLSLDAGFHSFDAIQVFERPADALFAALTMNVLIASHGELHRVRRHWSL